MIVAVHTASQQFVGRCFQHDDHVATELKADLKSIKRKHHGR